MLQSNQLIISGRNFFYLPENVHVERTLELRRDKKEWVQLTIYRNIPMSCVISFTQNKNESRLFCVINFSMISIYDAMSKFNDSARRYHLKYDCLSIKVTIEYKKQRQIFLSLCKKESNKSDIYQEYFQIKLSILPMNQ